VTIDVLPDDVLVEIFFYVNIRGGVIPNPWHALVHVCRRWRYIVFASPLRLNLQLEYGGHRPMSEVLDVWPVLPVKLISGVEILPSGLPHPRSDQRWNNIVAALESEHYDVNRICEINITNMTKSRWRRFAAAMQKPFPELTHLEVSGYLGLVPVLPDSFLGGSAPRLQYFSLGGIPFPSIPKLLLSANGLVTLTLDHIPDSGYISPDVMATVLTVMTRLESLSLRFRSPLSLFDPGSRPLPPPTRDVLPALTELIFKGVYGYLEDLLARIDAPRLYYLSIRFFMDLNFDVPQLHRLIGHAEEFKAFDHAEVWIFEHSIQLDLRPRTGAADYHRQLELRIKCKELDWQLSSLAQVCSPSFPLISALEELEIKEGNYLPSSHWKDDMENAQWLELLDSFTVLKNLYLTCGVAPHVCGALQKVSVERATEVLPALRNIFVDGFPSLEHIQEAIRSFVAARQFSSHLVTIDHWRRQRSVFGDR